MPSQKHDWKKFEKNNVTIALNVFVCLKKHIHVSKNNSDHEKKIILLMIRNGEGCHFLPVKTISALIRRINNMVIFIV